jgi:hypothetical protein
MTSTKINITTIQGNSRTTPSGIEILELPLNRSGRLKKANLDEILGFTFSFSTEGRSALTEGRRFHTLCTKLIANAVAYTVGLLEKARQMLDNRYYKGY